MKLNIHQFLFEILHLLITYTIKLHYYNQICCHNIYNLQNRSPVYGEIVDSCKFHITVFHESNQSWKFLQRMRIIFHTYIYFLLYLITIFGYFLCFSQNIVTAEEEYPNSNLKIKQRIYYLYYTSLPNQKFCWNLMIKVFFSNNTLFNIIGGTIYAWKKITSHVKRNFDFDRKLNLKFHWKTPSANWIQKHTIIPNTNEIPNCATPNIKSMIMKTS